MPQTTFDGIAIITTIITITIITIITTITMVTIITMAEHELRMSSHGVFKIRGVSRHNIAQDGYQYVYTHIDLYTCIYEYMCPDILYILSY